MMRRIMRFLASGFANAAWPPAVDCWLQSEALDR